MEEEKKEQEPVDLKDNEDSDSKLDEEIKEEEKEIKEVDENLEKIDEEIEKDVEKTQGDEPEMQQIKRAEEQVEQQKETEEKIEEAKSEEPVEEKPAEEETKEAPIEEPQQEVEEKPVETEEQVQEEIKPEEPVEEKPTEELPKEEEPEVKEEKTEEVETKKVPVEEISEDIPKPEEKKEETPIEEPQQEVEEKPKEDKTEEVSDVDENEQLIDELKESDKEEAPVEEEKPKEEEEKEDTDGLKTHIYALRTTANREDQVMDFLTSNAEKKNFKVYSVIRAHGMRGYIFIEAENKGDAEQAAFGIPYARGILPNEIQYSEIEHMLEQVKREVNIQQNDIVEIISGPFKRENAKIIRIDKGKEEVVVELLEAAVPIPITLKMDAVKVIRRETNEDETTPSSE